MNEVDRVAPDKSQALTISTNNTKGITEKGKVYMSKSIDLTGQVFGELTVLKPNGKKCGKTAWLCQCSCGNFQSVVITRLTSHKTQRCYRCSCKLAKHRTTHGKTKTRIYKLWHCMRIRCNVKRAKAYRKYGAKGITVCDEWNKNFMSFYNWAMQNGYADNLTIDRIDNSKGYCPENCRWITHDAQARNKTTNVRITHNGETKVLAEWCRIYDFYYQCASRRYRTWKNKGIKNITLEMLFKPTKMHQQGVPFEQHSS